MVVYRYIWQYAWKRETCQQSASATEGKVLTAARRAAEATKEGGFFGIGGTRVSEAEQRALDEIKSALS